MHQEQEPECEYGHKAWKCGTVVRGWHGRHICGYCLGFYRDGQPAERTAEIAARHKETMTK